MSLPRLEDDRVAKDCQCRHCRRGPARRVRMRRRRERHQRQRRHRGQADRPGRTKVTRRQPSAASGLRTVTYQGVQFDVPADWPVHDLAADPTTCVRFDVHAVYLGHPGADMDCPAGIIGRADAVLVEPTEGSHRGGRDAETSSADVSALTADGLEVQVASDGAAASEVAADVPTRASASRSRTWTPTPPRSRSSSRSGRRREPSAASAEAVPVTRRSRRRRPRCGRAPRSACLPPPPPPPPTIPRRIRRVRSSERHHDEQVEGVVAVLEHRHLHRRLQPWLRAAQPHAVVDQQREGAGVDAPPDLGRPPGVVLDAQRHHQDLVRRRHRVVPGHRAGRRGGRPRRRRSGSGGSRRSTTTWRATPGAARARTR